MPGWRPVEEEQELPEDEHPEIIGHWDAAEGEEGCWLGEFAYYGDHVILPLYTMRDWEFATEDSLERFPVRWAGSTLEVDLHGHWSPLAQIEPDGSFVTPFDLGTCRLAQSPERSECWDAKWTRPHPIVPADLPRNAGPILQRCDGAGNCLSNQVSLSDYLCRMHGVPAQ